MAQLTAAATDKPMMSRPAQLGAAGAGISSGGASRHASGGGRGRSRAAGASVPGAGSGNASRHRSIAADNAAAAASTSTSKPAAVTTQMNATGAAKGQPRTAVGGMQGSLATGALKGRGEQANGVAAVHGRSTAAMTGQSPSEIYKEAKAMAASLATELVSPGCEPWDRMVEGKRQRLRSMHRTLILNYPSSPHSQSLDHLWISTSHIFITTYRALIAQLDKQHQQLAGGGAPMHPQQQQRHAPAVELRKVLTRFRQFLGSEVSYYRRVIGVIVHKAGPELQDEVGPFLSLVGVKIDDAAGQVEDTLPSAVSSTLDPREAARRLAENRTPWQGLSRAELREKAGLVHKALVCLGDLERYREQYGAERDRKQVQLKPDGRKAKRRVEAGKAVDMPPPEQRFVRAKEYYEVARALAPDNGNPSNQLAVVATYVGDRFGAIYHYARAMAVRKPFETANINAGRLLSKALQEHESGEPLPAEVHSREAALVRHEQVVLHALLRFGDVAVFGERVDQHIDQLAALLAGRAIPSETIVRIVVLAMAAEWQARMRLKNSSTAEEPSDDRAMYYLSRLIGAILDVATEAVPAVPANDSALADEDDDDDDDDRDDRLQHRVSAVLRRLSPSLRIISKWIKVHADVAREDTALITSYDAFINKLARAFPLERLPQLDVGLEEDVDMRGFGPIKDGMNRQAPQDNRGHPNEDQLMRISDLLVDARMMGRAPATRPITFDPNLPAFQPRLPKAPIADVDSEIASVSTETEDDPVTMAMRATLGDGSSVGAEDARGEFSDDEDEEEEEILWRSSGGGNKVEPVKTATPAADAASSNLLFGAREAPAASASNIWLNTPASPWTLTAPTSNSSAGATTSPIFAPFNDTTWSTGSAALSTPRMANVGVIGQPPRPQG